MSQATLKVTAVTVAQKIGFPKKLLLTLEADAGQDIDAIAAQITENEDLDIELPTHSPNG